jgi:hypothetical protein
VYRGQKKVKYYRDATTFVAMGRAKPATELGQYSFRTVDLQYAFPATGTDYDGSHTVTGDTLESRITTLISNLQAGLYVELQDAKGRHLYGTLTQDPEITDETGGGVGAGWRSVSMSFAEIA